MRITLGLILALALASCATPEERLRTGLQEAGLSSPISACMAHKMANELSLPQLQRIASLASLKDTKMGQLSLAELLHRLRALKDEHIWSVTSRAGVSCAIDSTH